MDTSDGLYNGADGVVHGFTFKYNKVETVNIRFHKQETGKNWMRNKYPTVKNSNPFIVSIPRIVKTFHMRKNMSSSQVTRKQMPIRPNTAITCHRGQGRTIQEGVIDLSQVKDAGMHYVALSRFPNLSKILILNLNEKSIKIDNKVVVEMQRLRSTKQLQLLCTPIEEIPKPKLRIMFQNVRSLRKHFQEIKHNKEFQSAHVLLFCETWLSDAGPSHETFLLDNFKSPTRIQGWNDHTGLITYCKYRNNTKTKTVREDFELMHIKIDSTSSPYSIILFYRPSSSHDVSNFIEEIKLIMTHPQQQNNTFVLMGDANIDLTNATNTIAHQYTKGLQDLNLKQLIRSPTTTYRSNLDHIWISDTNINTFHDIRTSYYSDHSPLLLDIN